MHKSLVIAVREYNAAVRTKAFIISIVLMPILMGGGVIVARISETHKDTSDQHIAVIDRSGMLAPALTAAAEERNANEINDPATGARMRPAYIIDTVPPDANDPAGQRLALSDRVRDESLHSFIEIGSQTVEPPADDADEAVEAERDDRVAYFSQGGVFDDAEKWLKLQINGVVRDARLAALNMDRKVINRVAQPVKVEGMGLVTRDEATGQIKPAEKTDEFLTMGIPMITMMLMFMMVMMGAMPLINSVLEEKMQRIAEVLLGSVSPFQLMIGKLVGTVGVSFTVLAVYLGGATIAAYRTGVSDMIPFDLVPWFLVYQAAAILMFGAVFAAIGSACNDIKEAQSLQMPVWILVCIPMFVWIAVLREPASRFATAISLCPPCTPMLMLLRQSTPTGVPAWQPWAGLGGVLVCTVICIWLAGRIFRVGILLQGKPPKVSAMMRWALRG